MKEKIFFILSLAFIFSCSSSVDKNGKADFEIVLEDGIYVEKFDSNNTTADRFTADNQTYRKGNKLTYDYYYQDKEGNKFKFQEAANAADLDFSERGKAWFLVSTDSLKDETVDKVVLTVVGTNDWWQKNKPDYDQTVISYKYPKVSGETKFSSTTGLIENTKNVWAHPPRDKLFRILEINPFPFIQAPYEVGNKWDWSLKIGSSWGDERWKIWEGAIENKCQYEITDKKMISTKLGEMECYEIQSTATSSIGQTHLTAYFNMDKGFVKLDFTNIDATKTVLEMDGFDMEESDK